MTRAIRMTTALAQSTKVEAITWTGSGDGIIAGGIEVVLWKNNSRSWEIVWKYRAGKPQILVSATWSIEGPLATAAYASKLPCEELSPQTSKAIKCVFVSHSDGNSEYLNAELRHPQPVSLIRWRPSTGRQSTSEARHSARYMLLTCCFDGAVRLWSEIDNGKIRKMSKDVNVQKTARLSFCVVAVIEINHTLNGTLGTNIYITWATEIQGIINTDMEANQNFMTEGHELDNSGKCEWIIGFGPGMMLSFWAVHCLDDMSPMRFPRVTFWKQQKLQDHVAGSQRAGNSNITERFLLNKVAIIRKQLFGPPILCSLIQLLPCNSLDWSLLYTQTSNIIVDGPSTKSRTEDFLPCCVSEILNVDGHAGCILQVGVHPCSFEVEVAASLDSKGVVLFWSLSTNSFHNFGLPTLYPTWKFCGKLLAEDTCSKYTSLRWAPLVLEDYLVLLMGHVGGIDCVMVKIPQGKEKEIVCHNLCTITFTSHVPCNDSPVDIFSIPFPSSCNKTCKSFQFLLLAVWMKDFHALSWKITLHSSDLSESCPKCSFDSMDTSKCGLQRFESTFYGKRYCIVVDPPCSLQLPDAHNGDQVTSFAVICPDNLISSAEQKCFYANDLCSNYSPYHMAMGCSDGSLKLWRSNPDKPMAPNLCWELVGALSRHQGPISAVSLTSCGRKIATVCPAAHSNAVSTLHLWGSVHLAGSGSFILEDSFSLDGNVVSLNWLALGNGQLLLGVCMQNELRIYAQRRCGSQTLRKYGPSWEMHVWSCIAVTHHTSTPMRGFLWGPRATAVIIHNNYFSLFGQLLFFMDRKDQVKCHPACIKNTPHDPKDGTDRDRVSAIFSDGDIHKFEKLSMVDNGRECKSGLDAKVKITNDQSCTNFAASSPMKFDSGTKPGFCSMLEIEEKLCGSLPVYHPTVLLMNIYSGNWKRAYIAVRHLVEYLTSNYASGIRDSTGKFSYIPQIHLSNYLDGPVSKNSVEGEFQLSESPSLLMSPQFQRGSTQFGYNSESDASNHILTSSLAKSELSSFVETLEKLYDIAAITNMEKMEIIAIVDLLKEISNPHSNSAYGSLDEPGRRFWVAIRFQQLYFHRKFGRLASMEELIVDSELIGWVFHSDYQEILFGSFLPNEPSWQEMRTLGVGFWFTNAAQLRTRMEKLARSQYLKNKDPKSCALLYVALNRIQVLAGLFKISKDEKDKPLVAFLSRNFQEEKNKAAALKNAYVLMGRHQLELAIAFFLLGGDTSSAVNVCARNLGDEQLALVICRLVEGHGGPLEHHLISKFILPSAMKRGDSWLASLMEWLLGNYSQSFLSMLAFQTDSVFNKSALMSNHAAFLDPSIGQYCLTLTSKTSMRNAVGEQNAAILSSWANLMTATALNRCGLPLEALECLSSSPSIVGITDITDKGSTSYIGNSEILSTILKPMPNLSSNWLFGDVALTLESHVKLDLAMKYLSKLIKEHPSWLATNMESFGAMTCLKEQKIDQYRVALENFQYKLHTQVATFEQKFSLIPASLMNLILVSSSNSGLLFIGYDMLHRYTSQDQSQDKSHTINSSHSCPILPKILLKSAEEISCLLARFIVVCSISCSQPESSSIDNNLSGGIKQDSSEAWHYYIRGLILLLKRLRSSLEIFSGSCTEDIMIKPFTALDLFEYFVDFAFSWFQRTSKGLILMVQPLLITCTDGLTPYEIDVANLKRLLHQAAELLANNLLTDNVGDGIQVSRLMQHEQCGDIMSSLPEDERWKIIGTFLWRYMFGFMKHQSYVVFDKLGEGYYSGISWDIVSPWVLSFGSSEPDGNSINNQIKLVSVILVKILETTLAHVSSHWTKQFALYLWQKVEDGLHVATLAWLQQSPQSQPRSLHKHLKHVSVDLGMTNENINLPYAEILWDICADPKIISDCFAQEKISWSQYIKQKPFKKWSNFYEGMNGEFETEEVYNQDGRLRGNYASSGAGSTVRGLLGNGHTLLSSGLKDSTSKQYIQSFQNPKDIYKRNGELLEALCINSIDKHQAALAGNKKGIIFFNWEDALPFRDLPDYIWSEADWPKNGWAGSESTPVPTCVSPGIGLGSKKGAHLGLGGATIGMGSFARPVKDLTGGGAFGIPGYAGIGASGLGWEIQEEFEEFIDPPATVENINTRAFSSHPSRPFFLVGSSNTHIYLWEFGKDKATATYGVLPAANVPPPYALASIAALQFDHFGHRFATAASDGTVCTWQLEVGGRSNIRPTESSLCFNSHASDITYVTSSGSIIAVAGCSSTGVNVVIWDTLAPHATSRASIVCHEGGARSLAVFDNDIGSGSISPLIVTGGKGGDIGLHDFRYIATGRTKRHRRLNNGELNVNASATTADMPTGMLSKSGYQNAQGMLWYIPKAHLGSVTKISTIPNTSLFLTGSKDGDVKLWDAKSAKLVFHWSKLHERHTFLQPSSRGFGGVVRAAVTDIQVVSHGFLTCGGDGSVKLVQLKDYLQGT
ncbi:uncharacterized protein LOC131166445 isoform X2 [Malania oleifera]|uniref:uncharacterized protein LOC131166445 isoform X2 n=1 Tax=Malania oleifera TaxID=397392 RepID=UPI0025ADC802|nr:uncharacterized protein LOC131166445 isoform X2 [Malania oleifera]